MYAVGDEPEPSMPTLRPRLTITLTPEIDRALTAFSKGTGQSRSSFILEILTASLPALENLALVVQRAKAAKPEALAAIQKQGARMQTQMEALAALALQSVDLFAQASQKPPSGRSPAGGRRLPENPAPPPPSNRGVGTPPGTSKVTSVSSLRRV